MVFKNTFGPCPHFGNRDPKSSEFPDSIVFSQIEGVTHFPSKSTHRKRDLCGCYLWTGLFKLFFSVNTLPLCQLNKQRRTFYHIWVCANEGMQGWGSCTASGWDGHLKDREMRGFELCVPPPGSPTEWRGWRWSSAQLLTQLLHWTSVGLGLADTPGCGEAGCLQRVGCSTVTPSLHPFPYASPPFVCA